ncbi:MAG: Ig-like domain-containing protein, partial [Methanoregulaceae archaeon]|nr:Ig-like domain-containing protein [Methanoregulaceae archaeon]
RLVPPPVPLGIVPKTGTFSQTVRITNLSGTNFTTGAVKPVVNLSRTGFANITAYDIETPSPEQINCTFDLTGLGWDEVGAWDVTVTNSDGQCRALEGGFSVVAPASVLKSITPGTGTDAQTVRTSLSLEYFRDLVSPAVNLTRAGFPNITAYDLVSPSPATVNCTFDLNDRMPGRWDVVVSDANGQSATLANGFTITPSRSAPAVTGIVPASGRNVTAVNGATITGTGFFTSFVPSVNLTRAGFANITATNVAVVSPTQITCRLDITGKQPGNWDVVVTNHDGQGGVLAGGFEVLPDNSTTTALTTSRNRTVSGEKVTLTATVRSPAGTPSGTVVFRNGTKALGTSVLAGGKASLTKAFTPGVYTITATFRKNSLFLSSTSPSIRQTVTKASSNTTITSSHNPSHRGDAVRFTATVKPVSPGKGTRTGTVQFMVDGVKSGPKVTLTATGKAVSRAISTLATGAHTVKAIYSGDKNFRASTGTLKQRVI